MESIEKRDMTLTPLALALLHNGGAALLVMALTARLTGPANDL